MLPRSNAAQGNPLLRPLLTDLVKSCTASITERTVTTPRKAVSSVLKSCCRPTLLLPSQTGKLCGTRWKRQNGARKPSLHTVLTLPCVLSPFRSPGFALSCAVSAHLRFALPAVRYSMEHTFDYTVTLFSPSATSISELCLLRLLLTSHSSLLLR